MHPCSRATSTASLRDRASEFSFGKIQRPLFAEGAVSFDRDESRAFLRGFRLLIYGNVYAPLHGVGVGSSQNIEEVDQPADQKEAARKQIEDARSDLTLVKFVSAQKAEE